MRVYSRHTPCACTADAHHVRVQQTHTMCVYSRRTPCVCTADAHHACVQQTHTMRVYSMCMHSGRTHCAHIAAHLTCVHSGRTSRACTACAHHAHTQHIHKCIDGFKYIMMTLWTMPDGLLVDCSPKFIKFALLMVGWLVGCFCWLVGWLSCFCCFYLFEG